MKSVETQLDELSEGKFFPPERIRELIKSMPGIDADLAEWEVGSMEKQLPRHLSPEIVRKIERMRELTRSNIAPYILSIPQTIKVFDRQKTMTLANFSTLWEIARYNDDNPTGQQIVRWVGEENSSADGPFTRSNLLWTYLWDLKVDENKRHPMHRAGGRKLRAYSAGPLEGTREKSPQERVAFQREMLGEGSGIESDALFALLFHNLAIDTRNLADKYGVLTEEGHQHFDNLYNMIMSLNDGFMIDANLHRGGPNIVLSHDDFTNQGIGASFDIPREKAKPRRRKEASVLDSQVLY